MFAFCPNPMPSILEFLNPPTEDITLRTEKMRNHSWLRKNWMWVAGGAFLGIHLGTWALQKVTKNLVRSEQQLRNKVVSED